MATMLRLPIGSLELRVLQVLADAAVPSKQAPALHISLVCMITVNVPKAAVRF